MKRLKPKWRPAASAESEAVRILPRYAEAYLRAGSKAAHHEVTPSKLHQFRLATKDFRYLLELFEPLYRIDLKPYFEQLRGIQTMLGELNDYAVTREMMAEEHGRDRQKLLDYLDKEHQRRLKRFVKYWHKHFSGKQQQSEWIAGLGKLDA